MFNKYPSVQMPNRFTCDKGWAQIGKALDKAIEKSNSKKKVLVLECYHGVRESDIQKFINTITGPTPILIKAEDSMKSTEEISKMVFPDVTDDRIFGRMTFLELEDYFDASKIASAQKQIEEVDSGLFIVFGIGATLVASQWDILVYADMARWEIQMRMRNKEVDNIGVENRSIDWMRLYKQGYFVDWRVCDRRKKRIFDQVDFFLDTNTSNAPKLVTGEALRDGLTLTNKRPFSVVPFFDPGPWGGQWMKEVCDLPRDKVNYAWCFNCVPEENSLYLKFGEELFETPSINLVFFEPEKLLGSAVYGRFGDEFPIRFDFLDTMDGGNLSLQVHPLTTYIKEKFGLPYTQDESYYILDSGDDAIVYLGIKDDAEPEEMISDLRKAEKGDFLFDADKYINTIPVEKHDHILIPAGTVHCSGTNTMVLEISATPYIFTFKLWDWGRLGLDGKPRPINVEHGKNVIQWDRREEWTKNNLVNSVKTIRESPGVLEESTGLHELQFIETRRHWFSEKVSHDTCGTVNVVSLVDGDQVCVTSPTNAFKPFLVNYAEVFVVPAQVGPYDIVPYGTSEGKTVATLKAYVRS